MVCLDRKKMDRLFLHHRHSPYPTFDNIISKIEACAKPTEFISIKMSMSPTKKHHQTTRSLFSWW